MEINKTRILSFPKNCDVRGCMTYLENENQIPFSIGSACLVYGVPRREQRIQVPLQFQCDVIISLSGSIEILVEENESEEVFLLNRPEIGLFIAPEASYTARNFSDHAVGLVLRSVIVKQPNESNLD